MNELVINALWVFKDLFAAGRTLLSHVAKTSASQRHPVTVACLRSNNVYTDMKKEEYSLKSLSVMALA